MIPCEQGELAAALEVVTQRGLELWMSAQNADHGRDRVVLLRVVRQAEYISAQHDFPARMIAHELRHCPSSVLATQLLEMKIGDDYERFVLGQGPLGQILRDRASVEVQIAIVGRWVDCRVGARREEDL